MLALLSVPLSGCQLDKNSELDNLVLVCSQLPTSYLPRPLCSQGHINLGQSATNYKPFKAES